MPSPSVGVCRNCRGGGVIAEVSHFAGERGRRVMCPVCKGTGNPPMTITISQAEQDHHMALRQASYELAIQRGHIRR